MPTNDERRRVAARLRDFDGFGYPSWKDLCNLISDFIEPEPERTCRNNAPNYLRFLCSECGKVIYHDNANEAGNEEEDKLNYCPNCGCKVNYS